jgi:phasin family protein
MSDRKVRKNKAAQPSVLENPATVAEPQGAAEFHIPETLVAPCAVETASVEALEMVATAPVVVDSAELAEIVARAAEPAPAIVTAEAAPATAIQSIEQEGPTIMTDQINETIENTNQAGRVAADRFQSAFGDINERAKTGMEKSAKVMEEMTELTRGNVEALVASSKVAARGVESLTQEAADFGRRSFEGASAAMKSFTEVKSASDFFRLQSDFARAQFDAMVSESSKLSETMLKLAGDVAQPLTNRYTVAAERVKTLAN